MEQLVQIRTDSITLEGSLGIPRGAPGVVVFAHGSGSSRLSPRNTFVAHALRAGGLGTLLTDLLTGEEDASSRSRFDIDLLTRRLMAVTAWLVKRPETQDLSVAYFGASTGAAAALNAAAALGRAIAAIVSRGGRPDLAEPNLHRVVSPTLLIVGGHDEVVLALNRRAYETLTAPKELVVVQGATHLFEEPGALEEVARLARDWFTRHVIPRARALR